MSNLSQRNYRLAGLLLLVFFALLIMSVVLIAVSARPGLP